MTNKLALITGASSGIGREFARYLSSIGYNLILVARREDRLLELKKILPTNVEVVTKDLSNRQSAYELYEEFSNRDIDVLINNAGFGDLETFDKADNDKLLHMIELNVVATHILMKKFLEDFVKKNKGYILNVGSSAGLMPGGPYMATYYASKAYVVSLSNAVYRELKNSNSNVMLSVLCPGPVDTEFNEVANCKFSLSGISPQYCAKYAIDQMFKGKVVIVPSIKMKFGIFFSRFLSIKYLVKICGKQQKKKG
ncbi:SDR family NAD(P)-dependent oxidoreductase [Peptostreptococcus equinus]|uniref:SDR family oxidoreductase n=1 Tax=Peptostreptococcus equinus TaxID=3003601 RepID=A0ABY7JN25_9FIRM|nr:SDR family oxidoreductase [Peptostreptococcus sp. CBA3647]WAW14495.1 SDR family oxidoreductase [Peptostreptococcus sp. CBA3647]